MPKKRKKISLKTKRRLVLYTKVGLISVGAIGFFVTFLILVRLPEVTVAVVTVEGTHFAKEALVKEVVLGQLKGSYVFLVPKRNTFVVPEGSIKKELLSVFPAIQDVSFNKDSFNSLSVTVSEKEPLAKWCSNFSSTSPCYLVDENGFVFAPEEGGGYVTYSGTIEGSPVGNTFLEGGFKKLHTMISELEKTTNRTPDRVVVDEHDDVTVLFKEGGEVRFVRMFDESILLDNIASVFASRRFKTDEQLLYADFRFGNKVYVKFVGE